MAAIPPQGPSGPSQPPPIQTDTSTPSSQLSWEGDKMFNIYIYDYCYKRGFRNTARELMAEAEIVSDPTPPINARQGLLFEWWSVFWVLFQAKSNGGGNDDGLVYVNQQALHHQQQQAQRANQRGITTGPLQGSIPLGNQSLQQQQQQQHQQQQPHQNMARLANGLPAGGMQSGMSRPPSYMPNGAMPNGAGMGGTQHPHPQPGGSGPQMNFGGIGGHPPPPPGPPQVNGIPAPGPSGSQQQQQQLQPGQQPPPGGGPPGQPIQFTVMSGPRQQIMNGLTPQQQAQQQQQQQRPGGGPPNGGLGPFHQSPTMSHSPGQPPQPGQGPSGVGAPGSQAPMAQLGPSPHMQPMNRGGVPVVMGPPQQTNGGPPGMSVGAPPPQQQQPGGQPQQAGGPPTPGYQPGQTPNLAAARPPSRSNTPRGTMLTQASPSLPARQAPGGVGNPMMGVVGGMPMVGMAGMGAGPSNPAAMNQENSVNQEIMGISQNALNVLKMELGLADKDLTSLTMNEKNRILSHYRSKTPGAGKPGPMQNLGGPQGQQPGRAGVPPQQRGKRSSTSPGEDHETLPRNESSPPERKRMRRSPGDPPIIGYPQHPGGPQPPLPGQPGQPPQQQQPNPGHVQAQMSMLMAMRAQHPTMGMPGPGPSGPGGPMQQQGPGGPGPGQQQMHPAALMGMHPGGGPMIPTPQQQMQHMYRMKQEQPPFNTVPPQPNPGSTPQFNSSPLNTIRQAKPPMPMGMMPPPPSPAQGGPPKGMKTEANDGQIPGPGQVNVSGQSQQQQQQQGGLNPDGSPRNAATAGGGPSNGGTAPPTPVPTNRPNPQQQQPGQPQQSQPPPPGTQQAPPQQQQQPQQQQSQQQQQQQAQQNNPMAGMMPSPLSMLGMNTPNMNLGSEMMFDTFTGMEDFESAMSTTLFARDTSGTDINFERDFGQWFNNPDDLTGGLGAD